MTSAAVLMKSNAATPSYDILTYLIEKVGLTNQYKNEMPLRDLREIRQEAL